MLLTTRVTKAAFTAVGGVEIFHQIKFSLYYRNKIIWAMRSPVEW